MVPLKKVFPIIVVLITLSLLGLIYIQFSWIHNASIVRREQIEERAINVLDRVREEMLARTGPAIRLKMNNTVVRPTERGLTIDKFNSLDLNIGVSDRFTTAEVRNLLISGLKREGLDTTFEFAIVGKGNFGESSIKMQSAGFPNMATAVARDSVNYLVKYMPLLGSYEYMTDNTETMVVLQPRNNMSFLLSLGKMVAGGTLFTAVIITAFALTIRTMLNQKKISEIKSDFINNMTHELKTPLATISLAIDAIGNEKVMDNKEKIRYFSGIIKEENKRMNKQVESILQSALLEKNEIGLKLQPTDVHEVITHTVENIQLQLASKNGHVELRLDAINPVIQADDVHFSNVIFNLLDNAIKYSKENLEVIISTYSTRKSLVITVSDNGIGMSRDTISRIFEKFYRAHTGNVHNVKGFGLGLSYVKAIIDAHKGKIKVESAVGKGSKFTLEFPQD
ncbi:HAMP domain-containing sensor histidine kinase [Chitinophaga sancti]|uniref:histidine kinase n=2 Tax=Chitinophaga sancti TaxID=1004 RepID=A0A1K1PEA7_9BACT|nr:HAMP domain-containing sensor histidine kinase [Chitinophaga sancti]WQD65832.1 HAMP domain-containing sensor histidine kinase [Chitinophaga sancti]WQG88546.1 HAMP domain-containing sensor histidine kinase [Chitinophaga sancti]SFW46120.1 two-component system, OmpR family, phosphate regulon sensor histidine kinase PhoR [Chitinophaga sancti]